MYHFNKVLDQEKSNLEALNGLIKAYLASGNYNKAIPYLEKLNQVIPGHVDRMLDLSSSYIETNQLDKAKDVVGKIKKIDQDKPEIKIELGKIAFKEDDLVLAATLFKASNKAAQICSYFNNTGVALVKSGKIQDGIELYHKALKILPPEAPKHLIQYNIGLAHYKNDNLNLALEAFCQARIIDCQYQKSTAAIKSICNKLRHRGLQFDEQKIESILKNK